MGLASRNSQIRAREGSLLSGFNRRQIVQQLWQKERADKFIREKLPVGVFAGLYQAFPECSSYPCRTLYHSASLHMCLARAIL